MHNDRWSASESFAYTPKWVISVILPVLQPIAMSFAFILRLRQRDIDWPRLPVVYCAVQLSCFVVPKADHVELKYITGMLMTVMKKNISKKT